MLDSSARASLPTALSEVRAALILMPAAVHVRATRESVARSGQALRIVSREFSERANGAGTGEADETVLDALAHPCALRRPP